MPQAVSRILPFYHHFLVLELRERLVNKGFPQWNA